jgi:hypothetical protein
MAKTWRLDCNLITRELEELKSRQTVCMHRESKYQNPGETRELNILLRERER